jgi:hypothetical protein
MAPAVDRPPATSTNGHRPHSDADTNAELRSLCNSLMEEIQKLSARVDYLTASETGGKQVILRDVDARFQWLTEQLSERLVKLGNEIAAVKQQVGSSHQ